MSDTTTAVTAALHLHNRDNIVVLIGPVKQGQEVEIAGETLSAPLDLTLGHKLALRPIAKGEDILKYGAPIGFAAHDIAQGAHVHLHNIQSRYTVVDDIEGTNT